MSVSHRSASNYAPLNLFMGSELCVWKYGKPRAVPSNDRSLVCIVNGGKSDILSGDVFPHITLGPVADGKHSHVLPGLQSCIVEPPRFRALGMRIPSASAITK
jgi:hypothetical protein